jgi:hypothetical protein
VLGTKKGPDVYGGIDDELAGASGEILLWAPIGQVHLFAARP